MEILIKRLDDNAKLPDYSSEAGPEIDIYSLYDVTVEPDSRLVVSTGVAMALPIGYIGLLWNKHGVIVDEPIQITPAIFDSGHRDEIKVEIINQGSESVSFAAGDKIAQLLIKKVERPHLIEAEDLSEPAE